MNTNNTFTLIIPTYNSSTFVCKCLDNLNKQDYLKSNFEVIIIDDASQDNSIDVINAYESDLDIKVIPLEENGGPGIARNAGIDNAKYDWILFVDSDDLVEKDYLSSLNEVILQDEDIDVLGFNWARKSDDSEESRKDFNVGRRDGKFLLNKDELLENYLCARMDGSVIYTAMKKDILINNEIRFFKGIHEDIDFIYKVYHYAKKTNYLDKVLYLKEHREDSIINTISLKHIEGYVRAWKEIGHVVSSAVESSILNPRYLDDYYLGLVGMIASRVKEINRNEKEPKKLEELLKYLYKISLEFIDLEKIYQTTGKYTTSYCKITKFFLKTMEDTNDENISKGVSKIVDYIKSLEGKSWSCFDLQSSVFLRSNEVNTCCRRFFVNNERQGDVTILDIPKAKDEIITGEAILNAKKELHHKINTGIPNPCDGCPYLEYKDWGSLNKLDIQYISFEHHTVCNLRCSYCSDEYYGGAQAFYNVKETIKELYEKKSLDKCHTVVWGGGEPTVGKDFEEIIEMFCELLPNVKHRIVTNAIKKSPAVINLLKNDKIQITTSIDSGSKEIFKEVRGRDELDKVFDNLVEYANINAKAVTIKYLFTKGNGTKEDIQGFVDLIEQYNLNTCLFQISMDFKYEFIDNKSVDNMIILYGLLKKINCDVVFFDEIILQRIRSKDVKHKIDIKAICDYVGIDFIASPADYKSIVIWGASGNAKNLSKKSNFFKETDIAYFIDSNIEKQEAGFCKKEVKDPSFLIGKDVPLLITAVQGYSSILKGLDKIGFSKSNIIDKLII